MNKKMITGLVVLALGVLATIYAVHSMNRISSAKSDVNALTSPFSGSGVGKAAGNVLKGEASKYDTKVTVLLVGGIVLIIIGGGLIIAARKKRSRR
jgi:drug/metabolite transporter (DMT)-like permease